MDQLVEKHHDASTGQHYRYFASNPTNPPSKHTLLLLHGFPDSAALFQFIIPHLLPLNVRLVVPDLLGGGGTSNPTDPEAYTWPNQSDALVEILAKEGITTNIIPVGHDWGAALAQRFYMLHPSICPALITLNVTILPPSKTPFDLDAVNDYTAKANGYPQFEYWNLFLPESGVKIIEANLEKFWTALHGDVEDWMKKMFCVPDAFKNFLESDTEWKRTPLKKYRSMERLKSEWIAEKRENGMTAPTAWYRAMAYNHQFPCEKDLDGTIKVPYLFVGCTGDAVCRVDGVEIPKSMGLLPDCTVEVVEAAHWCTYEAPDEVAGRVVGWLKKRGFVG